MVLLHKLLGANFDGVLKKQIKMNYITDIMVIKWYTNSQVHDDVNKN